MPETQPTPLDAILAAADDAKRAHDRLCDLAETLLPESSPVKTAENPAPVVPLTLDEVALAMLQLDGAHTVSDKMRTRQARAVLDLIASRMPAWVPVEPGTVIKAGTHYRIEHVASFDRMIDDGAPIFIDPRTVPAEPEDPRVALLLDWYVDAEPSGVNADDARDLLTRLDAARADQ